MEIVFVEHFHDYVQAAAVQVGHDQTVETSTDRLVA